MPWRATPIRSVTDAMGRRDDGEAAAPWQQRAAVVVARLPDEWEEMLARLDDLLPAAEREAELEELRR